MKCIKFLEKATFTDPVSGVEVTRLTGGSWNSHHLYFTNSGWYDQGRKLLFVADQGRGFNLYSFDLADDSYEAVTELEPAQIEETSFLSCSVNPVYPEAYFRYDGSLYAVDLHTGKLHKLLEFKPGWSLHMTNVSADGKKLYFAIFDDPGFQDLRKNWEAKPESRLCELDLVTEECRILLQDREHWIAHCNTSPTHSELLTFCYEGPWERVGQRIWLMHLDTGNIDAIRSNQADDRIGHEYWFADGERIGYHGIIGGKPMLGHIRYDNTEKVEQHFPEFTGHIFSLDEKLIVGDGGGRISLWILRDQHYDGPYTLCMHNSSMKEQITHPHPRISPDGSSIIFTSDCDHGICHIYRVAIPEVDQLPPA